jgi:hypothetical protein
MTPVETGTFVFSLKEPVFTLLRQSGVELGLDWHAAGLCRPQTVTVHHRRQLMTESVLLTHIRAR